eukprot:11183884-Lingulodinium_polyedra.AAC.1
MLRLRGTEAAQGRRRCRRRMGANVWHLARTRAGGIRTPHPARALGARGAEREPRREEGVR